MAKPRTAPRAPPRSSQSSITTSQPDADHGAPSQGEVIDHAEFAGKSDQRSFLITVCWIEWVWLEQAQQFVQQIRRQQRSDFSVIVWRRNLDQVASHQL